MSKKDFICGSCKRAFASEQAVRDHIRDGHPKGGRIGIYQCIGVANSRDHDDDPSLAELAIEAEIDRAMGISNDDDWLLP